tara:strand:+ start:2064 stop:2417 length:354 start_codon:yes stop_codon:yes gene_type:complete
MAQYEEITIDQGSDVSVELKILDTDGSKKNLTGYSAAAKMKKTYNSDSDQTFDFTTAFPTPRTDGKLTLSLTNTQTDLIKAGRYVYDVEISHVDSDTNTIIERVLEGQITVTPSVTK